ncbi:AMP-binding protein [Halopseudomonas oceani]|uniref:AMP-binding protein n=1 Tax=Halopseudomonas oceani TaxID=1708783 RepID=UPI002AA6CF49|nr:AMP-binding protein [Halopseudomonas oceani]
MGALTTQPETALESFFRQETLRPRSHYLIEPGPDGKLVKYSWAEVGSQARRAAQYLLSLDLPTGSHIGLLSKSCAHWIIADLAIWMAGHVSVPLHPSLTPDSIHKLIAHADICALLVGPIESWPKVAEGIPASLACVGLPRGPSGEQVVGWAQILAEHEPLAEPVRPQPEQLATIIYTSGTTGMPKGVMLSFASMFLAASNYQRLFNISATDRMLSFQSLSHIAERQFIEVSSLLGGQQIYFVESGDTFIRDARRAQPTLMFGSPHVWQQCVQGYEQARSPRWTRLLLGLPVIGPWQARRILARLGLDQIRYAVSGAARLAPAVQQWFSRLGLVVVEGYGMTENCGYSHLGRPSRPKEGYIGLPNPGVECRLGEHGEILVRSKAVMMGYYKDQARTDEVLDENGFLHTGDVGEIDQEGFLRLTGRVKDIFKTSKGRYIAPGPIEQLLMDLPEVDEACVVGQELPQPLALVRLVAGANERSDLTQRALGEALKRVNATLPSSERLGCLVVVDTPWDVSGGFRTPTQKLRRNVVEATWQAYFHDWLVGGQSVVWHQSTEQPQESA